MRWIFKHGRIYPSYFKLQVRWLRAFTPVTYLSKLPGMNPLAAFLQLELFRVGESDRSTTIVTILRQPEVVADGFRQHIFRSDHRHASQLGRFAHFDGNQF